MIIVIFVRPDIPETRLNYYIYLHLIYLLSEAILLVALLLAVI
jgi:hypothetical protein